MTQSLHPNIQANFLDNRSDYVVYIQAQESGPRRELIVSTSEPIPSVCPSWCFYSFITIGAIMIGVLIYFVGRVH
jgi:hypothetical protein